MENIVTCICPYCNVYVGGMVITKLKTEILTCPDCKKEFLIYIVTGVLKTSKLDWVIEKNRQIRFYNLPSEQQQAVKEAIKKFEETSKLSIEEPCNCGSHIQHNNGGNYHIWYDIALDNGEYYIKEGSTCDMNPPYEWELSTKEEVYELIQNCADWL